MNIPPELKYTKDHEWAKIEGDVVIVGITDYAQGELGDIVYIELPEEGAALAKDEAFGTIEAVKAVSDLIAPISGEVVEVNEAIADAPDVVNSDPYNEGWMIKIKISDSQEIDDLLTGEQYQELI